MGSPDDLFDQLAAMQADLDEVESTLDPSFEVRPCALDWQTLFRQYDQTPPADFALRTCDHVASGIAGLVGGLLDLRPRFEAALTDERRHQDFDQKYKARLRGATGQDGIAAIDNAMGGRDHRVVGPTHDVTRLLEAIQCVRRGEFVSAVKGVAKTTSAYRDGLPPYVQVNDPYEALVIVLLHWSADFFSKMSLPLPGWSRLAELEDRDLVTWLLRVYREGANLRALTSQLLSNLSGAAAMSLLLHVYRYLDMFLVSKAHEPVSLSLEKDFRYRWLSRNANLVSFAISAGVAGLESNPFRINYVSFFRFCADGNQLNSILGARIREGDERASFLLAELRARSDIGE